MTDRHTPRNPPRRADHPPRAPDLGPEEASLAGWFESLDRPEVPADVRASVLWGSRSSGRLGSARIWRAFPLGAWGLASAALLLLALGAAVYVELSDPVQAISSSGTVGVSAHAASFGNSLTIVDDPRMALFHDVEMFDQVGRAPGELIADWGR